MNVTEGFSGREQAIVDLVGAAFGASEGPDEGAIVGGLIGELMSTTPPAEIRLFCAEDEGQLIGAVAFTRLAYPNDPRRVVLLSPMAVATGRQRQGVGQTLLTQALATLRTDRVDVVVTYGDPNYYGQVGFRPIGTDQAASPFPLSMPHGWLGQALDGGPMPDLRGPSRCVPAMNRAELW